MTYNFEKSNKSVCPVEDIAAFIDGELDDARATELDRHFEICGTCSAELNFQKRFLCDVSGGLKMEGDIDLPADFAKKIAVNAESSVSGLRRPRERFNAVFVCVGFALFALFALGTDGRELLSLAYQSFEQITAVGFFVGQLVYSFFFGLAVVIRAIGVQAGFEVLGVAVAAVFCVAGALRFRRRVMKLLRV